MSLISTVTSNRSVSPTPRPSESNLSASAGRQETTQCLTLLLALDDGLVQTTQALERTRFAG